MSDGEGIVFFFGHKKAQRSTKEEEVGFPFCISCAFCGRDFEAGDQSAESHALLSWKTGGKFEALKTGKYRLKRLNLKVSGVRLAASRLVTL